MKKLLTIDDDLTICETIRLIAIESDFDVTFTLTMNDFKEKYFAIQPDVITLDLNLADGDGIEILRWLASKSCDAKVIVISGFDEKVLNSAVLLCKSLDINIIAAFHKPINTDRLKILLNSLHNTHDIINKETLEFAVNKKEFKLFYQPKVSLKTGKVVGVEALIRWYPEINKVISPDSFIKIAEETGVIIPISAWVNHEAIRQLADLKRNGWDMSMSINISAKLLSMLELPDVLLDLANHYLIKPDEICLEITESTAAKNSSHSMDILTRFRIKGFNVSIDDFGTGYSSLIELYRMPCNELKIDKSFIANLEIDTPEYIIVRSIINLGHEFSLTLVGEGVETFSVLQLLKSMGCDIIQGYFIAPPMTIEELELWLRVNVDSNMKYNFADIDKVNLPE